MELWVGAINLGLLYAFMTMGVFVTLRIYQFPDITVDGSFTTGAAVASVLLAAGTHPLLALPAAFAAGGLAGMATAFIHTRFKIQGLLAGILVMTALYSVNLHVMGRSNIPLINHYTFLKMIQKINPGLPAELWIVLVLMTVMALFWALMSVFFRTDFGLFMRATGANPDMAAAQGVDVERMKLFGIALANALVGLSGAVVAQYQGFADIGMGIGTVVIGMAAVIVGESLFRSRSMSVVVMGVIAGSVLFRMMIAGALYLGMNPIDLKLITAGFVLLTLILSGGVSQGRVPTAWSRRLASLVANKWLLGAGAALLLLTAALWGRSHFSREHTSTPPVSQMPRIGVVQLADNGLLNLTRDGFMDEMERLGYHRGVSAEIFLANANGDLPTLNTILDEFARRRVDLIVPISTAALQVAIQKIQDRPVVFATVADPFIVGAGTSETDHLPHVTGVYGAVPMDRTLEIVRRILPGKRVVGCLWDPSQPNSVLNVDNLRREIEKNSDMRFEGATITGSSEVHEAAASLIYKGIDAFVLVPDNIVYSAFDAVIQAAGSRNIPIFCSDVERLADGALCALGYDYTSSGRQAAHLVRRILQGESPGKIPFERYSTLTLGVNERVATAAGIALPPDLIAGADIVINGAGETVDRREKKAPTALPASASAPPSVEGSRPTKRIALFMFNESTTIEAGAKGFMEELNRDGGPAEPTPAVDAKNAQNEYSMAQSIAEDIVNRRYDMVVTLGTQALQLMAQNNKGITHVFGVVTSPYRAGVARSAADHPPTLTGLATPQPVEASFQLMREAFPHAKRVGMVWNPGEANSEACTLKARDTARALGFELLESTVSNVSEVVDAVNALLNRGVDLFFTSGDVTMIQALGSVAEMLRQRKVPYITNDPSDVDRGALLAIGADYVDVGRETARLARRVLSGESPATIPIQEFAPEAITLNAALADEYGLSIPSTVLQRAAPIRKEASRP